MKLVANAHSTCIAIPSIQYSIQYRLIGEYTTADTATT